MDLGTFLGLEWYFLKSNVIPLGSNKNRLHMHLTISSPSFHGVSMSGQKSRYKTVNDFIRDASATFDNVHVLSIRAKINFFIKRNILTARLKNASPIPDAFVVHVIERLDAKTFFGSS